MQKIATLFLVLFLLAGCAPATIPTALPTAAAPATRTAAPVLPTSTGAPTATPQPTRPDASPNPTAPPAPKPTQALAQPSMTQTSGSLTVELFNEADLEVSADHYVVTGRAPAGTVLSVNDEILVIDQAQVFQVSVSLEEGLNLIEIVASNAAGDEVNFMITVTFIPAT